MTDKRTSLPQAARIVDIKDESAKVRTLVLDLSLQAEPGQFVMTWLPGVDEKPFSLVRANPVTLTIARVGPFSQAVLNLQAGDRLWVRGPLGRPFTLPQPPIPDSDSRLLLIAGGYGVAPLNFLAERARVCGFETHVIIGARTADDVILIERFATLGAQVIVTTEDRSLGQQGMATEAAEQLLNEAAYMVVYACGPEAMLEAVEKLARAHRLPVQLSYERYMRCAFGVCGSCGRLGWLVCRDGPVKHITYDRRLAK
jgi:dihydroorotate dehydrogenase electron transfer subunit